MRKKNFVIFCISTNLIVSHLGSFLALSYDPNSFETTLFSENQNLFYLFFLSVFIGPLVETAIYQYAIIEGVCHFFGNRLNSLVFAVILSSILFGLSHYYNPVYAFLATCIGLSFAIFYVLARPRKDISAFFLIFFTHSFLNLVAFVFNDIRKDKEGFLQIYGDYTMILVLISSILMILSLLFLNILLNKKAINYFKD